MAGALILQGFTGPELSAVKKPNKLRIAMIGGSAVWSGGVKDSIAANLENVLSTYYQTNNIRVINFGRKIIYFYAGINFTLQEYITFKF
jgi:hypothetical protein